MVQVKDYAKKLVTAMIWFTSRMKLDPKKERWDLSLVVKSFVLQKQCFSNLCSLYKSLSGFEHSVCQLQTFFYFYCGAVWGNINKGLADKLQKLQNGAARILTFTNSRGGTAIYGLYRYVPL